MGADDGSAVGAELGATDGLRVGDFERETEGSIGEGKNEIFKGVIVGTPL